MKRFIILSALTLVWFSPTGDLHAEEALRLDAEHAPSNEEAIVKFARVLKPTPEHDMFFTPIVTDQLSDGSHLRIFYQSRNPIPVEFGPLGAISSDMLSAILPSAENGDVLLSLADSPSWRAEKKGIVLKYYGKKGEEPHIQKLRVEDHLSILGRIGAYLRHPAYPERFTYTTMSEVAGYRMGGVSIAVILGSAMILLTGVLIFLPLFRKNRQMPSQQTICRIACTTCLCFLFFYETRFLIDLTGYTIRLQREWWSTGRLGHAGDVYEIAAAVKEETKGANGPVLLCKPLTSTPLRYLLYPIPLLSPEELDGASPALVITDRVWDTSTTSFECGAFRFDGRLIRIFPDGEALVGSFLSSS